MTHDEDLLIRIDEARKLDETHPTLLRHRLRPNGPKKTGF